MLDLTNPAVLEALATHDIAQVFRFALDAGMTQREIAERTQINQSEISEIISGRKVMGYAVMERICLGLDIPRGLMGLSYAGDEPEPEEQADEEMRRRALLGVASVALFGAPVLGEVLELPRPVQPTPLPARLAASDVAAMRNLTSGLQELAREYGGCAQMIGGVANRSRALLSVAGSDEVTADMSNALAELHTAAGWCCVDEGLPDQARAYFARGMDLGDPYQVAWALRHAGIQMVDAGAYNDALKAFQLAQMASGDPELIACLHIESAQPLAAMGKKQQAVEALKKGQAVPQSNLFDAADMDNVASDVYRRLGNFQTSDLFAKASLDKWNNKAKRDRVEPEITLAVVHLLAGETGTGTTLARRAIADITPLQSVRARRRLLPLEQALATKKDSTCQDLARVVRTARV